jgi:hypothetical protein
MTFYDFATVLEFVSIVLIIVVACWARCWLLLIGYLIQLPVTVQVLTLNLYRLFGIPWDIARGSPAYTMNRILAVSSTIIITVALVQLLCRFGHMRRSSAPK